MVFTDLDVIAFTATERSSEVLKMVLRSRTCVAPRDFRKSVLWSDAVVTMGEKPESRAN